MILTRRSALTLLGTGLGAGLGTTLRPRRAIARAGEAGSGPRASAFMSGGRAIAVERLRRSRKRSSPGRGRAARLRRARYRSAGQQVARSGYAAFLVHYFDRTGERRAPLSSIARNFRAWTETARDAVSFVAAQPGVDAARIGVLGVSLGGGLGIALAAQDPRVRALVDDYGFLPDDLGGAPALPPTLILHGDADRVVPVANARALQALLQGRGISYEIQIYPGQGHGFTGPVEADAASRIRRFLDRTLRG